jgi:hypothetical protein
VSNVKKPSESGGAGDAEGTGSAAAWLLVDDFAG